MAHAPRNTLVGGIGRLGRAAVYKKRALYKRKKTATVKAAEPKPATVTKDIGGDKNGGKRVVPVQKAPRFYPTEDEKRPLANRKHAKATKLRGSITPGTVLIVLSGKFKGKRVVFLKQLESGLLLVTGPFKVNGVPLRRINQAYVAATSTKVNLEGVTLDEKFNDAYFARPAAARREKTEARFFAKGSEQKTIEGSRVADQKAMDSAILGAIKAEPMLKAYLAATFSLKKGQYPHALKL